MKTDRETREQRIRREREEMRLRPWEFSPSEVNLYDKPFQPGAVGRSTWAAAQEQRREILRKNPEYFWDDPDGNLETLEE